MHGAPMTSRRLGYADFIHLAAVRLVVDRGTLWVTMDGSPRTSRSMLPASWTSTALPTDDRHARRRGGTAAGAAAEVPRCLAAALAAPCAPERRHESFDPVRPRTA